MPHHETPKHFSQQPPAALSLTLGGCGWRFAAAFVPVGRAERTDVCCYGFLSWQPLAWTPVLRARNAGRGGMRRKVGRKR